MISTAVALGFGGFVLVLALIIMWIRWELIDHDKHVEACREAGKTPERQAPKPNI